MFNQAYQDRSRKIIQYLLNIFNHKYFTSKSVLDLGAGHGDIGAAFFRLGASVTAVDARDEHLKSIVKKYPNIRTVKADLDSKFILNSNFNVTLFLGTLCHLKNYEKVLRQVCYLTQDLILETAVIDSDNADAIVEIKEHKGVYDASFNGLGNRVSSAKIESILSSSGMHFVRVDSAELNHGDFVYDWKITNSNKNDLNLRRFWIASKNVGVLSQISKRVNAVIQEANAEANPGLVLNINKPVVVKKTNKINNLNAINIEKIKINEDIVPFIENKKEFIQNSNESEKYKILVKFPTRSRPNKFLNILSKCIDYSNDKNIQYLISYDYDDSTMTEDILNKASNLCPGKVLTINGASKNKIHACNRDIDKASPWDIIVLMSDDMIPQINGWDSIIKSKMAEHYPDTDGILFFSDGFAKHRLNTMCILGKKYYDRFGYIYCEDYVSLWCDNEFMEVGYLLKKQTYFDLCLFKHEHPSNCNVIRDDLYEKNEKMHSKDSQTFLRRKKINFNIK